MGQNCILNNARCKTGDAQNLSATIINSMKNWTYGDVFFFCDIPDPIFQYLIFWSKPETEAKLNIIYELQKTYTVKFMEDDYYCPGQKPKF